MTRKPAPTCMVLILVMPFAVAGQTHGRATAAEERQIARCIHQSVRGKPWLETTLWGLRWQEGRWVGQLYQMPMAATILAHFK